MKYLFGFLGCLVLLPLALQAQEFNCVVKVNDQQLQTAQGTEREVFRVLERALSDFINTRRWTQDEVLPEERINCFFEITLLRGDIPSGNFEGTAQIRATRPIYGTNYESSTFFFLDRNFAFQYLQSQPLDFNENVFFSELTTLVGFYIYVMLGTDYDSFAKNGGSTWIEKAFNIANLAQNSSGNPAWQRGDNRNRYWIIENLMSQQMTSFREGMYRYHRLGLDRFDAKPAEARNEIMEVMKELEKINRIKPNSAVINGFLDAKNQEILGIFGRAEAAQKKELYDILVRLDPNRTTLYNRLLAQ